MNRPCMDHQIQKPDISTLDQCSGRKNTLLLGIIKCAPGQRRENLPLRILIVLVTSFILFTDHSLLMHK